MSYPLIDQQDLEERISVATIRRNYDDDNDGDADEDPIERLCKDASSKVLGYCRGIYDIDTIKDMTAEELPEELRRLTLDVAFALVAQRHPECVRRDWKPLMDHAEAELKALRKGETRLDIVGPPEPAANEGGSFTVGDPDTFDESTFKRDFLDGMGDF